MTTPSTAYEVVAERPVPLPPKPPSLVGPREPHCEDDLYGPCGCVQSADSGTTS